MMLVALLAAVMVSGVLLLALVGLVRTDGYGRLDAPATVRGWGTDLPSGPYRARAAGR